MKSRRSIFLLGFCFFSFTEITQGADLPVKSDPVLYAEAFDISPFTHFKTLRNNHFKLTFDENLEPLARKALEYFEQAHEAMRTMFRWEPRRPVEVLLLDNTDSANGLTLAALRVGIVIYAAPPTNGESLYYYEDWWKLVIFHEYTHFLNLDPTKDFWEVLRWFSGDIVRPNSFWSRWMAEGVAVYIETLYGNGGRGRSPYWDMVLRSAVEAGVFNTSRFITLDRINGPYPYFPVGQTPYLFGYELYDQMIRDAKARNLSVTADGQSKLESPEATFGEMSIRSAGRIPFFVNTNLENITGRNWYDYWDDFIKSTQTHAQNQLQKIQSQPVTEVEKLTSGAIQTLGSALSPDGKWLAYTQETPHRVQGLYLKNILTGRTSRIDHKVDGMNMSFTPDSKTLIYSEVQRYRSYNSFGALMAYDVVRDSTYTLKSGIRADEPHVNRFGNFITFTVIERGVASLAIAPLYKEDGKFKLGEIQKLYEPENYGRVSNPKFTPDGNQIVFSYHPNGKAQEDLLSIDLKTKQVKTLVSNKAFNRFPTFDSQGNLYFISDLTGVDNLYWLEGGKNPVQVTNVKTAVWFPQASPSKYRNQFYVSVGSYTGWDLGKITLPFPKPPAFDSTRLKIEPPMAPPPVPAPSAPVSASEAALSDYSPWSTLGPRQWLLLPTYISNDDYNEFSMYGGILGFDQAQRHYYNLLGGYRTFVQTGDGQVGYVNRSFGPTWGISANWISGNVITNSVGQVAWYKRSLEVATSLSYPIHYTHSVLTPMVSFEVERSYIVAKNSSIQSRVITPTLPQVSTLLLFSNVKASNLAVTSEEGRTLTLGSRVYLNGFGDEQTDTWKGLFSDTEHWRLFNHFVFVPTVAASVTSRRSLFSEPNVRVRSHSSRIFGETDHTLDELIVRGYGDKTVHTKLAGVASAELRFPIFRIFRGWGTHPLYFKNLWGFVFGDAAYFPLKESNIPYKTLTSAGGGLRLTTSFFHALPVSFGLQYHQGFREQNGGQKEVLVQIVIGG